MHSEPDVMQADQGCDAISCSGMKRITMRDQRPAIGSEARPDGHAVKRRNFCTGAYISQNLRQLNVPTITIFRPAKEIVVDDLEDLSLANDGLLVGNPRIARPMHKNRTVDQSALSP